MESSSSWGFWSWLFYVGLPGLIVTIYLLKKTCRPFENWWFNTVSIKLMGVGMKPEHGGHGHSHNTPAAAGHSHKHSEHVMKQVDEIKRALFKDLNKITTKASDLKQQKTIRILEIGTGRGANFKYYPDKCKLIALDAFDGFKKDLMENMSKYPGIQLEKFVHSPAENMEEIADSSVDVVIGTTVFCQVKSMKKVLSEIIRVLVPDGRFYYIEHIAAEPGTWTLFFQTILTKSGIVPFLTQGHLDRHMDIDILKADFSDVNQKYFQIHDPEVSLFKRLFMKLAQRNVVGVATK